MTTGGLGLDQVLGESGGNFYGSATNAGDPADAAADFDMSDLL